MLRVDPRWLRERLTNRKFAGLKRGGRWAMTEQQILDVIESMTVPAREPEHYPRGMTRRGWLFRERYGIEGNPNLQGPKTKRPAEPMPKVQPAPSWFHKVDAESPEVIAAMPDLTRTQLELLERLRHEGQVVISGRTVRRTVEALARRGLATYEAEEVLNETHSGYYYRFTVRPRKGC
jgi:hypothetical protein